MAAVTEATEQALSIMEAAEVSGLSVHTLRYYERTGLLEPVSRNGSGHRRYRAADLERIAFLTKLRATGMPIRDVRRYAELMSAGEATNEARHATSRQPVGPKGTAPSEPRQDQARPSRHAHETARRKPGRHADRLPHRGTRRLMCRRPEPWQHFSGSRRTEPGLGDRSWGQVAGSPGMLRAPRGTVL